MKSKNFEECINLVQSKFETRIERLRCNNGGEYVSEMFKELCSFKQTIVEMRFFCLTDMDKVIWGEAVRAAVYNK